MRLFVLLGAAACFAGSAPIAAKPDQGHDKGKHGMMVKNSAYQEGRSTNARLTNARDGQFYAVNARGNCPPGRAKKGNGCLPPGQAKKRYDVGQRYNRDLGNDLAYDQIPQQLRSQYSLNQNARYYYNNGQLYQVDPKTMLIQQAISALLK